MRTISKEDYIKTIFEISKRNESVKPSEVARMLMVSKPAITDMLKKLVRDAYVEKHKTTEIRLTNEGKNIALKLLRKHRLWEMFLLKALNLKWEEIHEEAENLEHSTSDYLAEKIDEYLGHPVVDPHGAPIPDKNGIYKEVKGLESLAKKERGSYSVKRISGKDRSFVEALNKIEIAINSKIDIISLLEFDNSLLIKVNGKEHIITRKFAEKIFVL